MSNINMSPPVTKKADLAGSVADSNDVAGITMFHLKGPRGRYGPGAKVVSGIYSHSLALSAPLTTVARLQC